MYKRQDLGTGKVTEEEMEGVPHHMLDVVEPNQPSVSYTHLLVPTTC